MSIIDSILAKSMLDDGLPTVKFTTIPEPGIETSLTEEERKTLTRMADAGIPFIMDIALGGDTRIVAPVIFGEHWDGEERSRFFGVGGDVLDLMISVMEIDGVWKMMYLDTLA